MPVAFKHFVSSIQLSFNIVAELKQICVYAFRIGLENLENKQTKGK